MSPAIKILAFEKEIMAAVKICGIVKKNGKVCQRPAIVQTDEKGLICSTHYRVFRRNESVKRVKRICEVPGCTLPIHGWNACNRHHLQRRLHGKILKRTIYDPNEIVIEDDVAEMTLYDRRNRPIAKTLFDADMIEEVRRYKWGRNCNEYVHATKGRRRIFLHTLVMGEPPTGKETDHKNRNRLDNRRENLRFVTHQENMMNMKAYKNNKSGVTGVRWHKANSKWVADIRISGDLIYLGTFEEKEDAINARKAAEEKYFKGRR